MTMDQKVGAVLGEYQARIRREELAAEDGRSGDLTDWLDGRLLAVGPETGQLLNLIASAMPSPIILELGTSYGYSAIWLGEAARTAQGRLISVELKENKSRYARSKARLAGLEDFIDFRVGDALKIISELPFALDFVLLDLWKELYVPCLEAFYPKLRPGAVIVADNMLHPAPEIMREYTAAVRSKPGISSILVPIGHGLEISQFRVDKAGEPCRTCV